MAEVATMTIKVDKSAIDDYEYLAWFVANCDFGPADSDVRAMLNEQYEAETGNKVPDEWGVE